MKNKMERENKNNIHKITQEYSPDKDYTKVT